MPIDTRFGEYIPLATFAEMFGKTRQTIHRWMSQTDGLPYLKLGRETYIPMERAREWLASRVRKPNPRRGRQ